jgi:HK97 family phage portal protein
VAFPRALRIVRDQETIAEKVAARSGEALAPHVREASSLMAAVVAANGAGVTRQTALQVPAVVKALKTYTAPISAFGLREYRNDEPIAARPLLLCPCSTLPYSAVMTRTVTDILLHDRAYWLVTARDWQGYPTSVQVMRVEDVNDLYVANTGIDPNIYPPSDPFYHLGNRVPTRDVIKFYGDGTGGWLKTGASAINTAAALEAAVLMYAQSPVAQVVLKNTGADLPAEQVDALLEAWEAARADHSTAYLNSTLEAHAMGINPAEMQMDQARNQAAIQIARLANLDPIWTGAGVPGSSLTYSNRIDLYRQLLDTALTPVMRNIGERLSMQDVTPRGHSVRFDTTEFLRSNPIELASLINTLLPLGVITEDEARLILDLPQLGVMSYTALPGRQPE